MSQPNNFGFTEEASMLKSGARKFFAEHLPVDQLHALVASDHDPERMPEAVWREDLWQQMVELGWTAVAVPESADGLGLPLVAVAGLIEEAGRAAVPGPLFTTLSATYLLAACGEAAAFALAEIADGRSATIAATGPTGAWDAEATPLTANKGRISGTACFVQDARKAERLLVVAREGQALNLYWLATDADGVTIRPDAILDLTRDQARVEFSDAEATLVGEAAEVVFSEAMPAIWTLLGADIVGGCEWLLQTTVEYAQSRKQFDHPLGFFQGVKHPLVNVMIAIDESKSLVYNAACAFDHERERMLQYAHMAKASASDTAGFAAGRAVQLHGGIGFTWECYVHLFFKRQLHSQMLWGDGAWHRARLADLLIGQAA
jgi:alkylation response protein AidB-like acyl-CoA dehydrogenase